MDVEGIEESVEVLHVRDVAAETEDNLIIELPETLNVSESSERAIGCYSSCKRRYLARLYRNVEDWGMMRANKPRLSAAMTTPSLYLTATTEVPVTTGDCVC